MITVKVTVEVEDVDSTDEAEARVRNAIEGGGDVLIVRHLSWDYACAHQSSEPRANTPAIAPLGEGERA